MHNRADGMAQARGKTASSSALGGEAPRLKPRFALIWFPLSEEAAYMTGQAINFTGGLVTW